jgi:hypothetical protein
MMRSVYGFLTALDTIVEVLALIVLLVGLILAAVVYLKKGRSKVALLGTIGFLLIFLLSCCSIGWRIANQPLQQQLPNRAMDTYYTVRGTSLFLFNLLRLAGLALLISAVWIGGKKE